MMKKLLFGVVLIGILGTCCYQKVKEQLPQELQSYVEDKAQEVKDTSAQQISKMIQQQINQFWESEDLADSLGISKEQQEYLKDDIEEYLEGFEGSQQQMNTALKQLYSSFMEMEIDWSSLTKEELEKKLQEIIAEAK